MKNRRGHPNQVKTLRIRPEWVYKMAGYGATQAEIAGIFGVDQSTISGKFSSEYSRGRELMKHKLRKAQLKSALKGSYVMQMWLGKQMLGQREPPHEVTGVGGAPIEYKISVESEAGKKLTEDILNGKGTD